MFYFLATYQMLSVSAINMTLDLMFNPLGIVTTEELDDILEDILLDDNDDIITK